MEARIGGLIDDPALESASDALRTVVGQAVGHDQQAEAGSTART